MSQSTPIVVVGIDVGKSGLHAHILPGGLQRHFQNDKGGRRALRNWPLKHGVSRAVFEPTARYHRRLHQGLYEAGLATGLVNPLRSRRFAESLGQLAKSDRVDAVMLARFGQFDNLASTPPKDAHLQLLSDLLTPAPQARLTARHPPQALLRTRPRGVLWPRRHPHSIRSRHRRLRPAHAGVHRGRWLSGAPCQDHPGGPRLRPRHGRLPVRRTRHHLAPPSRRPARLGTL